MSGSTRPIRLLLVEDSADDQALILRALGAGGRPVTADCVCSDEGLREALAKFHPDAVLSDFSMPGFSGQKALEIVQELAPETPFIFVSGTIGEELAIEAMQRGAADYVLKGNMRRLRPALDRALHVADERHQRRVMEAALRESDERFRAIVATTGDWIWQTDVAGRLTYSNDNTVRMLGYPPETLVGQQMLNWLVGAERAPAADAWSEASAAGEGWRNVIRRWRHADGTIRQLESTAIPIIDAEGQLTGFRGIDRDVTLRVQQATRIEHLARLHAVLSAFGNAILRSRDIDALLGMTCRLLVEQGRFKYACVSRPDPAGALHVSSWYADGRVQDQDCSLQSARLGDVDAERGPGLLAYAQARTQLLTGNARDGTPVGWSDVLAERGLSAQVSAPIGQPPWAVLSVFAGAGQEISAEEVALFERLSNEVDYARAFIAQSEQLEYIAFNNPTTDLPSRTALHRIIAERLARGPQAIAMADVHRFRYFNQSRGRAFGDQLLREVATRLQSLLPDDALLTHPGDDAFVFIYDVRQSIDAVVAHLGSVLARCCERPFPVDGEQVRVKLHGSVMLAPEHGSVGEDVERGLVDVLAEAQQRDCGVLPFTEDVRTRSTRRVQLENDLRVALERQQFELFLQPKFAADSRQLLGAEALLRWRHPQRGLISPIEFIPALENTGLIVEVGAWVREEGLRICSRWQSLGFTGLRLAVNVSVQELRQLDLVDEVARLVGGHPGTHGLDVEITESILMEDIEASIRALQALKELGCRIAIDDFGTGYSSLNYLSRLPVDTLKIDRSFVSLLAHSPDTVSLVTNIIGLAHSLGMHVVAEGVEDEEQAKLLRLLRCDELQGYLLGRPLPIAEFERTLLGVPAG